MYLLAGQLESSWLNRLKFEELIKLATSQAEFCGEFILIDGSNSEGFVNTEKDAFRAGLGSLSKSQLSKIIIELGKRLYDKLDREIVWLTEAFFKSNPRDELVEEVSRRLKICRLDFDKTKARHQKNPKTYQEPKSDDPKDDKLFGNNREVSLVGTKVSGDDSDKSSPAPAIGGTTLSSALLGCCTQGGPVVHVASSGVINLVVQTNATPFDILPSFDGRLRDCVEWFFRVEIVYTRLKIPTNEILPMLIHKLTGNAFQVAMRLLTTQNNLVEWKDFKARFLDESPLSDLQFKIKNQLLDLKMGDLGNNYSSYQFKFLSLANRLVDVSENELVFCFMRGLPLKINNYIIAQNANESLAEAMRVANRIAQLYFNKPKRRRVETANAANHKTSDRKAPFKRQKKSGEAPDNNMNDDSNNENHKIKCYRSK